MKPIAFIALAMLAGACHSQKAAETSVAPQAAKAEPMHEGHMGSAGANKDAKPTAQVGFDGMPALGTKAWCPVSHEEFTVNAKTKSSTYKGRTYVFCCGDCKPEFDENPTKFVN